MSTLRARGLRYDLHGRTIFSGVDLDLATGESLAVTGPSGSGKTTLLAVLAGLLPPHAGEVTLDGRPVTPSVRPAAGVAVVLQGYGLVTLLTAAENVEAALRAAGTSAKDSARVALGALEAVGLGGHAHHLVEELSGGQRQRTAVARAMALSPAVLLADEPTAELDVAARGLVLGRLFDLTSHGRSLIIATHDPDLANQCDRILYLHHVSRYVSRPPAVIARRGEAAPDSGHRAGTPYCQ